MKERTSGRRHATEPCNSRSNDQRKNLNIDKLVVGGLHMDDFEWASRQYEEIGYVLVAFLLDFDGYHWKAVYARADQLEKPWGLGIFGSK